MSMNTVPERLAALRAAMKANGVDAYTMGVIVENEEKVILE